MCQAVTTLKLTRLSELNEDVRNFITKQAEFILTTNSKINYLDLDRFSDENDQGEGAVVLSALASSSSLPTVTHFRCSWNNTWFSEGKESNVELLCDAIRAMTSLKYLNLSSSAF